MKLSCVIPAHNEEGVIKDTLVALEAALSREKIPHELLVVNDNSNDSTEKILNDLKTTIKSLRFVNNDHQRRGFGLAVRKGLESFEGDVVCVVMADASDDPKDVVKFYHEILKGYDCVFGSRFMKGSRVVDYPRHKLILNRIVNTMIKILFNLKYNDVTNAFKMYRAHVIPNLKPYLSYHFNLTVELPLKSIIRGHTYSVLPNSWYNRKVGVSKLKIKEMGSRYLFIIIYCLIEKWLSCGDYVIEKNEGKANELPANISIPIS